MARQPGRTSLATLLVAVVATGFWSCGGSAEGPTSRVALHDGPAAVDDGVTASAKGKITVCHEGRDKQVPPSALGGHLGHGDRLGTCAPPDTACPCFTAAGLADVAAQCPSLLSVSCPQTYSISLFCAPGGGGGILAAAAHAQQEPPQWPPAPPGGAMPRSGPTTTYLPSPQAGKFADAFGRFRAVLPAGAEQVNATYAFTVPASGLQINISVATRDAMFLNSLQSFPEMMRQSGAQNVGQQQFDHRGRQATMVIAHMRNPQAGGAFQSMNVFIPGAILWLQVNSPEQNNQQGEEVMRALLATLQHP